MNKPKIDIDKLSDNSISCRDIRHQWSHVTDSIIRRKRNDGSPATIIRTLICRICDTMKHQEYEIPDFKLVRVRMEYAENYLAQGIRIKPIEARIEAFERGFWETKRMPRGVKLYD